MSVLVLHEISDNSPVFDTLKLEHKYMLKIMLKFCIVNVENEIEIMTMFDDGLHGDLNENDGVWGIEIPIQPEWNTIDYRAQVITDNSPRIAPCEYITASVGLSPSDIKINELMPLNSS